MTRNKFHLLLGILALSVSSTVQANEPRLTLDAFLAQVIQANPSLEAAKSRAQAADHRVKPSSTFDDPFIAAGIDEIPFGGVEGSVTRYQLSQTIPFPGKLGARGSAAEKRAEAAHADAETTKRMLTVVAAQAFYRTFFNHRQIQLNEESRRYIQQAIDSTKSRYKTGGEGHHEWLLGKVELGVLDAERLRLGREQRSLHALLNELRARPSEVSIDLSPPRFSRASAQTEAHKASLATQPELKASQTIEEAAEADERSAKLSYLPGFVFQGMAMKPGMSSSEEMGRGNWGVMVGINLPIYFWRKQPELVSAAKAEQSAAAADRRSLENRLKTELIDANEQLQTAKDVVALYERDVIPTTEIAVKNARSGYAAKRLPLTQLLETLRVERTQKLEHLAARIDVDLAGTRIENLLSSPPAMRFAPTRPTLFGSGAGMGNSMSSGSSTINMGSGMSGPTRKESKPASNGSTPDDGGGMGNM